MEDVKVFDLTTGELCRYPFVMPSSMHYDPDATCPRWLQFLQEITCGDKYVETMIKRMVGYCMTDSTAEEKMFVLHGDGCNGKSTFVNIIMMLMGKDYACATHSDLMFGRSNAGRESCTMTALIDYRLVVLSEPISNAKLCSSKVRKLFTCNDRVITRVLYVEQFEYVLKFKIMLTTNFLPKVEGDDAAVWRRLYVVPFKASFAGELGDRGLLEKLKRELPGIFNWALEGAAEWYEHGLLSSEVV